MAAADNVLLLPGFGGKYQISLSNTQTSGAIDMSRCSQFAVGLTSEVGANSGQLQQSFDGATWTNLGAAMANAGTFIKYDLTDGPHGLVRIVQTGAGSGVFTLVGFGQPVG